MSNTTFSGPVRSENGFEVVSKNATTGAVTVTATLGASTNVSIVTTEDLTATGVVEFSGTGVFMTDLPTTDPVMAGQLWNDSGTLKISAGA